jgi:hypothetical protein
MKCDEATRGGITAEDVWGHWPNMSVPCELGRNMLGCVEIIGGVGFYSRPVVSMAAKKAAELKC